MRERLPILQLGCLLLIASPLLAKEPPPLAVGAKAFTESVTLAEIATLLGKASGVEMKPTTELGGTRVLWSALKSGEIDVYPEYTGTIREELFRGESLSDFDAIRKRLAEEGISMTDPLGFNNTYAIGVKRSLAEKLNLKTISDLKSHANLTYGFGNEFMDRADGWPSLKTTYGLNPAEIRGMEHALAYRALAADEIQVTDAYSTDPNIRQFNLQILQDDRFHFPRYDAIYLYRTELEQSHPQFVARLKEMSGKLSDEQMLALNQEVELGDKTSAVVAAQFVREAFRINVSVESGGLISRIWRTTLDHLFLVIISLFAAILIGVPAGVIAAKTKLPGQIILGAAEIVQTIPGLALLVFMGVIFIRIDLPSIGAFPVIVALFLYSLLPIIRNAMVGLNEIPASLQESATALGLNWSARLRLVELPLAAPLILAGIKTTAVINVGYAALGGLIGAGGYGQPIMTGLRLNSERLMLEGAIPAAFMALAVKLLFEKTERFVVPKGLRLQEE